MASKTLFSFFLIMFSSYLHIGLCDNPPTNLDQLLPGLGQISVLQDAQCMQKMLPCQAYLSAPNNPPQTCCDPLKEMYDNKTDCLCSFLNNPQVLQSFKITKEDALKLPQACGITVDASLCSTGSTGATSQSPQPSEGEDVASADESSKEEESTSSTKMITAYGIVYFGVPGFVALLSALVFSTY
ncbi:lipid transfer-like protein VAS [Abrus precatorius]|uniref:Lipid transfer-like protein VAS n=1 Tax=Abrus precatorius TaxID=3816 RepID=A0A8B8LM70_ABRPR|nr:lipid transfer-like protein VAS [Abrus precatorius]